ncbi:transposase, partial [Candidatus Mycobacterium methanotrophicum]|uniref:transposase n=1 Tax=Candidatus Mycobacterium methanotrophicum TaxID=2943498 RepID=UPI00358DD82D
MGVALAYPRVRRARPHHPPLPGVDLQHPLDHGLSNARSEATNTHLRTLTKRAYGFHSP